MFLDFASLKFDFEFTKKPRPVRFAKSEQVVEVFIIANPSQDSTLIFKRLAKEKLFFGFKIDQTLAKQDQITCNYWPDEVCKPAAG